MASLIFGAFISLNILVWCLIQGRKLGRWASKRMGPVPPPVAYEIFANSARFFRGYLYGSTLVGLFNGAVMGVGALIIGVPLAGTIFVVGWFTNYIPFFGAIVSGAFAVLIALGSGGPSKAIPMLIIVIISNGYLQTIVSQFALGSALKLHPLAVLFATTAGSALFGAVGGIFAAPFLKIFLDARLKLKAAGLFSSVPAAGVRGAGRRPATRARDRRARVGTRPAAGAGGLAARRSLSEARAQAGRDRARRPYARRGAGGFCRRRPFRAPARQSSSVDAPRSQRHVSLMTIRKLSTSETTKPMGAMRARRSQIQPSSSTAAMP